MTISEQLAILKIAPKFKIEVVDVNPISAGLINHSYQLVDRNGGCFFLQKINTAVFPNPLCVPC
jgi:hypothetical protein